MALGALGVITRVTLRCVPLFTLRRLDLPRALDEMLGALDELVDSNDHFEFYGFPYTGRVMTRESERSDRAAEPTAPWKRWLERRRRRELGARRDLPRRPRGAVGHPGAQPRGVVPLMAAVES